MKDTRREGNDRREGIDRRSKYNEKMNSPELQKNFHNLYKDFFNAHDIVLSGNAILTW